MLTSTETLRCAESFLLKDHRWPAEKTNSKDKKSDEKKSPAEKTNSKAKKSDEKKSNSKKSEFECDTFSSRGHNAGIARVLGSIRKERLGDYSAQDVIDMFTLPEDDDKDHGYLQLEDFFSNLGIELTSAEKAEIVEGMALEDWAPAIIARFVGSIKKVEKEAKVSIISSKNLESPTSTLTSSPVVREAPIKREAPIMGEAPIPWEAVPQSRLSSTNGGPQPKIVIYKKNDGAWNQEAPGHGEKIVI
jgi:hypothetical protein